MNLQPFTGSGSTPSRRRFWDKVAQVVIASQKSAGRNVSVNVHDGYGTIINVDRKQGTVTPPSPCACSLPDADCPHSLGISVLFDDTDTAQSTFVQLSDEFSTAGVGFYEYDAGGGNYKIGAYSIASGGFVEFTIPTISFFNVVHTICATFNKIDDSTVTVGVTVDGSSNSFTMPNPSSLMNRLFVGSLLAFGASHRAISCIQLLANPASDEHDFNFPPGSFDAFTAGASIVAGAVRIDQASGDSYATKNLSPGFTLACPCCGFDDCSVSGTKYRTKVTQLEWTASNPSATCGDCSSSGSITKTERYDLSCSVLTTTCSGTASADCGGLHTSCTYDLVDGSCLLEPSSDCPADPFTLFLLCAGTASSIVTDCSDTVATETRTADNGTGTFTITITVSDPAPPCT